MRKKMNRDANAAGGTMKLREHILIWQRRLADYLNEKCQHLSLNGMLALLIAFSLAYSFCLLRLIINAIH